MNLSTTVYKILLLIILGFGTQSQCLAGENSKYHGAKLVELDALMKDLNPYASRGILHVFNEKQSIGVIYLQKFRTQSTAVEIATQKSKEYQLLSKPTSGWFTDNDSTFEATSPPPSGHVYFRAMKSDGECYIIMGVMSEEYWKSNGASLRSLVDSFRFN